MNLVRLEYRGSIPCLVLFGRNDLCCLGLRRRFGKRICRGDDGILLYGVLYCEEWSTPHEELRLSYCSLNFKRHLEERERETNQVKICCSSVVGSVPSSKSDKRWKLPILTNVRIRKGIVCEYHINIWVLVERESLFYLFSRRYCCRFVEIHEVGRNWLLDYVMIIIYRGFYFILTRTSYDSLCALCSERGSDKLDSLRRRSQVLTGVSYNLKARKFPVRKGLSQVQNLWKYDGWRLPMNEC